MSVTIRRTSALFAAAALTLSLAACSGGQSVEEACKIAEKSMADVTQDSNEVMKEAMSGEADFAALLDPSIQALDKAVGEVTNKEVSVALENISTEFTAFADEMKGFKMPDMSDIDYSDPNALDEINAMQEDLTAMSDRLQERSTAMMDAGTQLQTLCNAG